jgi:hypothetical protein
MKTKQGFAPLIIILIIAALAIGGGVYYVKKNKTPAVEVNTNTQSTTTVSTPDTSTKANNQTNSNTDSGWKTYTNSTYGYSFQYPSNWYVNTQYSNQDYTPRGPAPYDYVGGDTSISNYSVTEINEYQKANGDLAYPKDYILVNLAFSKVDPTSSLSDYLKSLKNTVPADKQENVVINGLPGIRLTNYKQTGIGGVTKPNFVNVDFKVKGELISIGYGFDNSVKDQATIADKIINSFTLTNQTSSSDTNSWKTYTNVELGFTFKYPPTWKLNDGDYSTTNNGILRVIQVLSPAAQSMRFDPYPSMEIIVYDKYQKPTGSRNSTVAGQDVLDSGPDSSASQVYHEVSIRNIKFFTKPISIAVVDDSANLSPQVFNTILSTFKFTN